MPTRSLGHSSSNGTTSTSRLCSSSRRNSIINDDSISFEDLALRAIQALNPDRQLQLSDIRMGRIRKLIGKFINGQIPSKSRRRSSIKSIRRPSSTKFDFSSLAQSRTHLIERKNSLSSQSSTSSLPKNGSKALLHTARSPLQISTRENKGKLCKDEATMSRDFKQNGSKTHVYSPKSPTIGSTKRLSSRRPSTSKKLPRIDEEEMLVERKMSNKSQIASLPTALKRKISFQSVDSQEDEELIEKEPKSQLELLVERVLGEKSTLASFDVLKQELHSLFKSERSNVALNKKLLNFLDSQLLRSEISSQRQPQKNIQCIEVQILVELQKLKIRRQLDSHVKIDLNNQGKVLSKLRFLSIITGGKNLNKFIRETMDSEFALALPTELKQLHDRMCVQMSPDFKLFGTNPQTTTVDDLFSTFGHQKHSNNALSVDTPSSLESTPSRRRSNSTPQSSSSAVSGFHEDDAEFPTLERMTSLDEFPKSPTLNGRILENLKENGPSKSNRRRKISTSSSSSHSNASPSKISTRRTTLNTEDDLPPKLSSPESTPDHSDNDDLMDISEIEPPPLTPKITSSRRTSRATAIIKPSLRRKSSVKEATEEPTRIGNSRRVSTASKTSIIRTTLKVDARGSIASRRQTNKRLCVMRQTVKDLILPTSRRSSTASLLQKNQQQQASQRRSSYFERLAQELQRNQLSNSSSPVPTKRSRLSAPSTDVVEKKSKEIINVEKQQSASTKNKKAKQSGSIITNVVLNRYRKRMNDLYENSKKLDEHEVFYGRCNVRVDLFETEKNASDEEQKPTTSKAKQKSKSTPVRKQKNRSGHMVKQANADCLYIAHTLLNVHNKDPLSSERPKPGTGALIWGAGGRKAATLAPENQPFRIRRLVRHANRAKFLKLRQYIQRSQQQQLLKKIKQEKEEEEEIKMDEN